MKIYGLKNCDSCRKAVKELEAAGIAHTYVDVRTDGVPVKIIENWLKQIEPEIIVNKRSTTWRGLSDLEKNEAGTSKAAELLAVNPTLIKRPVIERDGKVLVGWTPETKAALGL